MVSKIAYTCLLFMACVVANAQNNNNSKSLKIGDQLPEIWLNRILLNGGIQRQHTSDYKDKLLVLDFWDTYCASCIAAFPKLDSLQKQYAGKMELLTVTWQKEDLIRKFKATNKLAKAMSLPILVEDTLLKSYFPHRFVSHTVWINKGVVVAITGSEYIDGKIIDQFLAGKPIRLPVKNDFGSKELNNSTLSVMDKIPGKKIYSIISGYMEGATNDGGKRITAIDSVNGTVRDAFINIKSIVRLYLTLFHTISPRDYVLKPDMIFVEAANPENYDVNYIKKGDFMEDWIRRNSISYESVLPASISTLARAKVMVADLNNKLGLYGRMELRPHQVLMIKAKTRGDTRPVQERNKRLTTKKTFEQFRIELLANIAMAPELKDMPPVFADPALSKNLILNVYEYRNRKDLERMLELNNLQLIEELRPIEVFVLTELNKK